MTMIPDDAHLSPTMRSEVEEIVIDRAPLEVLGAGRRWAKKWKKMLGISLTIGTILPIAYFFWGLPIWAGSNAKTQLFSDIDQLVEIIGKVSDAKVKMMTEIETEKENAKREVEKYRSESHIANQRMQADIDAAIAGVARVRDSAAQLNASVEILHGAKQEDINKAAAVLDLLAKNQDSARLVMHITELESKVVEQQERMDTLLPIGSIIAWHKDAKGDFSQTLPDGWVECSMYAELPPGAKITEIPDLNSEVSETLGGRFLRGGSVSGVKQVDYTRMPRTPFAILRDGGEHSHAVPGGDTGGPNFSVFQNGGNGKSFTIGVTGGTHNHAITGGDPETCPVNMSVVWIIRVK